MKENIPACILSERTERIMKESIASEKGTPEVVSLIVLCLIDDGSLITVRWICSSEIGLYGRAAGATLDLLQ